MQQNALKLAGAAVLVRLRAGVTSVMSQDKRNGEGNQEKARKESHSRGSYRIKTD